MPLSVDTTSAASSAKNEENESPLGKRKPGTSCSDRDPKRSPLSNVANAANFDVFQAKKDTIKSTPMKRYSLGAHTTPYSASKFKPRVSKDEVQATNEGRASVHKLSEWLASESAKKEKPKRIVPCTGSATPLRFRVKPKINKEDVEATDDKRVSVKTLSEWISDDPFEQKKLRHIRSGAKVIAKSRVFEMDKAVDAARKVDVKLGSVHEKQAWLNSAFKHDSDDGRPKPMDKGVVQPRPYQNKNKKVVEEENPEEKLKTVNDKKEWLKNAFKATNKNDQQPQMTIQATKSMDGSEMPSIMKCASADEAHRPRKDYPCISQPASCDGMSTPYKATEEPVRLYQTPHFDKEESPEMKLKSVHDKQAWLSNAFKKPGASVVQSAERVVAAAKDAPMKKEDAKKADKLEVTVNATIAPAVTVAVTAPAASRNDTIASTCVKVGKDDFVDNNEEKIISVADRAKWLRGAFK